MLTAKGEALTETDWDGALYRETPPTADPAKLTAIPYFAWANRQAGPMTVWIHESAAPSGEKP